MLKNLEGKIKIIKTITVCIIICEYNHFIFSLYFKIQFELLRILFIL
jgi:hypothetical protein